jgi:hypothetical protein
VVTKIQVFCGVTSSPRQRYTPEDDDTTLIWNTVMTTSWHTVKSQETYIFFCVLCKCYTLTLSVLTISTIYVLTLTKAVLKKSIFTVGLISIVTHLYVCIKFHHSVFQPDLKFDKHNKFYALAPLKELHWQTDTNFKVWRHMNEVYLDVNFYIWILINYNSSTAHQYIHR